jgi:glyoxylase-like metal-dependent hydrolase (beta-lactamase superfamily II)
MNERIASGIWLVGGGTLTYAGDCLCYGLDLGVPVLIDCGCGPGWPRLQENLAEVGLDWRSLHTLVLTHGHVDHMGAAARVQRETGCRVVAHAGDVEAIQTGDSARTAADWYDLELEPMRVDHVVAGEGETLRFPAGELHLLHTPGHTPGSMVAWLDTPDAGRVLFGQDVHGPLLPAFGSDRAQWRASLARLLDLDADVLCEGHYGTYRGKEAVGGFIRSFLD